MSDINCPYCGSEEEICHDDGYGYDENQNHNQSCGNCGKTFVYTTAIIFLHETFKADCLNEESEHDWIPTNTFPSQFTQMKCSVCDETRELTQEEKNKYIK